MSNIIAKQKSWSFSQLNNYETCPKKYWHLAVNKDYKEIEGEAILYGKRVHKAFELFVKSDKPLPQDLSHMQKYIQKFADFPGTKLVEQQLCITKDYEPTHWKDWTGGWCRAIIDLALVGDKSALLVDYKTGKMKDDGFTQLKLATALFMIHNPKVESVNVAYLWTEAGGVTTEPERPFGRDDISGLWNDILPRVNKFQRAFESTEYPPKPSGLCRKWCIIESCPHHGE